GPRQCMARPLRNSAPHAGGRRSDVRRTTVRSWEFYVRTLQKRLERARKASDRGASAVEYGLLVALIAVVIAATVYALGTSLKSRFNDANTCVKTPSAPAC